MMRTFKALLLCGFYATQTQAEVRVEPNYQKQVYQEHHESVSARGWVALPFSAASQGMISAQVTTLNETFGDGSAFLCDEQNFRAFQAGHQSNCQGQNRVTGTIKLSFTANRPGTYYLLLDNRFSALTTKHYQVSVQSPAFLRPKSVKAAKETIQYVIDSFKQHYIIPNFSISVRQCGLENAYSNYQTGDIVICSELVAATINQQRVGAFFGIMFHELGHSLLNLWGLPNFANEETVDEFATYILMQIGEPVLVEQFASYFEGLNPWVEANRIIHTGGTHPISVQRARNIRRNAALGRHFTYRWNKALYPHMSEAGLRSVQNNPSLYDDPNLARKHLMTR